jgi:hypothetical protein
LSELVSLKSDTKAKIIKIRLDILFQLKSNEHKDFHLILFWKYAFEFLESGQVSLSLWRLKGWGRRKKIWRGKNLGGAKNNQIKDPEDLNKKCPNPTQVCVLSSDFFRVYLLLFLFFIPEMALELMSMTLRVIFFYISNF